MVVPLFRVEFNSIVRTCAARVENLRDGSVRPSVVVEFRNPPFLFLSSLDLVSPQLAP